MSENLGRMTKIPDKSVLAPNDFLKNADCYPAAQ